MRPEATRPEATRPEATRPEATRPEDTAGRTRCQRQQSGGICSAVASSLSAPGWPAHRARPSRRGLLVRLRAGARPRARPDGGSDSVRAFRTYSKRMHEGRGGCSKPRRVCCGPSGGSPRLWLRLPVPVSAVGRSSVRRCSARALWPAGSVAVARVLWSVGLRLLGGSPLPGFWVPHSYGECLTIDA